MESSQSVATEYLTENFRSNLVLEKIRNKDVSSLTYYPMDKLYECDVFWVSDSTSIGQSRYIAVPKNEEEPFTFFSGE